MDFRKSLLLSLIIHIILILLLPGLRLQDEKLEWVEVSILTFPDEHERIPDRDQGEQAIPEPSAVLPEPERTQAPLPADEIDIGIPVEELRAPEPELTEDRHIQPMRHETRRAFSGRIERRGVLDQEGTDSTELISGPVSRRAILRKIKPDYPGWAEESGIEGETKLKFWVTPEGLVAGVELVNTSGYPDFDSRAIEAVKKYIFSPLSGSEEKENQWGTITIKYRL